VEPGQLEYYLTLIILIVSALLLIGAIFFLRHPGRLQQPPSEEAWPLEPPLPRPTSLTAEEKARKTTSASLPTIKVEREPAIVPASGRRPPAITWQIAGLTDRGMKRTMNEDNLLMIEGQTDTPDGSPPQPFGLYIVADGMGGHDAGEVASKLTVQAIQKHCTENPPTPTAPFDKWLKAGAMTANQTVLAQQADSTREARMGSTLVMALVMGGEAHVLNVGDSRAYHLTDQQIQQISKDHSLVARLIEIGQLTPEEARSHPQRNVIYSTIGDKPKMDMGYYQRTLASGDRLLLCSDGLSGMVPDEELLTISRHYPDPAQACKAMIEAAKVAGGDDNITVIIVQLDE
jgi:protein phosphatase